MHKRQDLILENNNLFWQLKNKQSGGFKNIHYSVPGELMLDNRPFWFDDNQSFNG